MSQELTWALCKLFAVARLHDDVDLTDPKIGVDATAILGARPWRVRGFRIPTLSVSVTAWRQSGYRFLGIG